VALLHRAETALAQGQLQAAREHCAQAMRRFLAIGFELGQADVDRVYAGWPARGAAAWPNATCASHRVYQEHGE
jgi:flagellar biosynthesis/type III secretory pathway protein FliH